MIKPPSFNLNLEPVRDGESVVFIMRLTKENQDKILRAAGLVVDSVSMMAHSKTMAEYTNEFAMWCAQKVAWELEQQ